MKIGSLGKIIFKVSSEEIKTISKMQRKGSAKIQEHERHLKSDLPEFVGRELDEIKFEMRISKHLGASLSNDIGLLRDYSRKGTAVKLIIAKTTYGNKWLVADYNISYEDYDKQGHPVEAVVLVDLKEYPKV